MYAEVCNILVLYRKEPEVFLTRPLKLAEEVYHPLFPATPRVLKRITMALPQGGGMAVGVTLAILLGMGILGFTLTTLSRNRQYKQDAVAERSQEEGRLSTVPKRVPSKPLQLPVFKTRSSLSMSSASISPKAPKSPGIRFTVTSPSHHSRRSASIDSLPSVGTVLERYETEEDARARQEVETNREGERDGMLKDQELGEPGPAVPLEPDPGPPAVKKSLWGRPNIGLARIEEAV